MSRAQSLFFSLLIVLLVPASAGAESETFKTGIFDPPRAAPDFELHGSNGAVVKLSQFRGKVVALVFGFTYCQKVCPITLANLTQVSKKLGATASDFQVVYVTVDPARDTPSRLNAYLKVFNATYLGATGTPGQLDAVRHGYGVTAVKEATENSTVEYQMHHSSSFYLIDRVGKLRLLVPFGKSADDVVHDVKLLLKK